MKKYLNSILFLSSFCTQTFAAEWLPTANINLQLSCTSAMATTDNPGKREMILGTGLSLIASRPGISEEFYFYDESNYGSSIGMQHSEAGCLDCLVGMNNYSKMGISEHFWFDVEYGAPFKYCPNTSFAGQWFPGDFCQQIVKSAPGCVSM